MKQPMFWMRVWDAPTRLFHWGIVILVAASWLTGQYKWLQLHVVSGYAIAAGLLFRLIWGVIGSQTARFATFLRSPLAGLRHLRRLAIREPDTEIGHNAAGGWMVILLLALLLAQVVTGLFAPARHGRSPSGPLAQFLPAATGDGFTAVHHLLVNVVLAAIGVHVLVVLAYAVLKRQDLVRPMITGRKRLPGTMRAPRMASPLLALVVFAVAAIAIAVLSRV